MKKSLELPESVYRQVLNAAKASGTTPAAWIQDHLPRNVGNGNEPDVTDDELAAADAALDECIVSLGHPVGTDNEQIDADLARNVSS